jgi:hypothetical protein
VPHLHGWIGLDCALRSHNLSGSAAFLVAKGSHLYCNP